MRGGRPGALAELLEKDCLSPPPLPFERRKSARFGAPGEGAERALLPLEETKTFTCMCIYYL